MDADATVNSRTINVSRYFVKWDDATNAARPPNLVWTWNSPPPHFKDRLGEWKIKRLNYWWLLKIKQS